MALAVLTRRVILTAGSRKKLSNRQSWKAIAKHYETMRNVHLLTLFANDPKRGERVTLKAAGLFLDYSKNRIIDESVGLLCQLAEECGLGSRIKAMLCCQLHRAALQN